MLDRLRLDDKADQGARRAGRGGGRICPARARDRFADIARQRASRSASAASRSASSARTSRRVPTWPLDVAGAASEEPATRRPAHRWRGAPNRRRLSSTTCSGPPLEGAGLPPAAVGLVRSSEREGARVLVTMPERIPLVILRGSGEDDGCSLPSWRRSTGFARWRTPRAAACSHPLRGRPRPRAHDDRGDARPARRVQPAQPRSSSIAEPPRCCPTCSRSSPRRASTYAERSGRSRRRATEFCHTTEIGSATNGQTRPSASRP